MTGDAETGDPGPSREASPGSTGWAHLLGELRDAERSPRRSELRRLANGMRGLLHRLVQTTAPVPVIAEAADQLEGLAARFEEHPNASIYEGFAEAANSGDPFAFFDHSPMLGVANPLAPPIELWLGDEGDRIVGRATFGAAYEGPPGCVHGGYIAAAFDEVLGCTQSLSGSPGMTGRLTVNYRSPTPLHTELRFEGSLERVDGRKIFTLGQLWAGDTLCAEAEGLFISMEGTRFADLKEQRDLRRRAQGLDGPTDGS
ncbi:MAG: PaaI family thioesterase [Acidimicrobiales bacterium]|nr:PaaI family thioesterase [Acidimicrobiales bacterium]